VRNKHATLKGFCDAMPKLRLMRLEGQWLCWCMCCDKPTCFQGSSTRTATASQSATATSVTMADHLYSKLRDAKGLLRIRTSRAHDFQDWLRAECLRPFARWTFRSYQALAIAEGKFSLIRDHTKAKTSLPNSVQAFEPKLLCAPKPSPNPPRPPNIGSVLPPTHAP